MTLEAKRLRDTFTNKQSHLQDNTENTEQGSLLFTSLQTNPRTVLVNTSEQTQYKAVSDYGINTAIEVDDTGAADVGEHNSDCTQRHNDSVYTSHTDTSQAAYPKTNPTLTCKTCGEIFEDVTILKRHEEIFCNVHDKTCKMPKVCSPFHKGGGKAKRNSICKTLMELGSSKSKRIPRGKGIKGFPYRSSFKIKPAMHHVCNICSRSFKIEAVWRLHMKRHRDSAVPHRKMQSTENNIVSNVNNIQYGEGHPAVAAAKSCLHTLAPQVYHPTMDVLGNGFVTRGGVSQAQSQTEMVETDRLSELPTSVVQASEYGTGVSGESEPGVNFYNASHDNPNEAQPSIEVCEGFDKDSQSTPAVSVSKSQNSLSIHQPLLQEKPDCIILPSLDMNLPALSKASPAMPSGAEDSNEHTSSSMLGEDGVVVVRLAGSAERVIKEAEYSSSVSIDEFQEVERQVGEVITTKIKKYEAAKAAKKQTNIIRKRMQCNTSIGMIHESTCQQLKRKLCTELEHKGEKRINISHLQSNMEETAAIVVNSEAEDGHSISPEACFTHSGGVTLQPNPVIANKKEVDMAYGKETPAIYIKDETVGIDEASAIDVDNDDSQTIDHSDNGDPDVKTKKERMGCTKSVLQDKVKDLGTDVVVWRVVKVEDANNANVYVPSEPNDLACIAENSSVNQLVISNPVSVNWQNKSSFTLFMNDNVSHHTDSGTHSEADHEMKSRQSISNTRVGKATYSGHSEQSISTNMTATQIPVPLLVASTAYSFGHGFIPSTKMYPSPVPMVAGVGRPHVEIDTTDDLDSSIYEDADDTTAISQSGQPWGRYQQLYKPKCPCKKSAHSTQRQAVKVAVCHSASQLVQPSSSACQPARPGGNGAMLESLVIALMEVSALRTELNKIKTKQVQASTTGLSSQNQSHSLGISDTPSVHREDTNFQDSDGNSIGKTACHTMSAHYQSDASHSTDAQSTKRRNIVHGSPPGPAETHVRALPDSILPMTDGLTSDNERIPMQSKASNMIGDDTSRPKTHQCSYCNKVFDNHQFLTDHIHTHTRKKLYKCKVCGVKCASLGNLRSHIRQEHYKSQSQVHRHTSVVKGIHTSAQSDNNRQKNENKKSTQHRCTVCKKCFNDSFKLKEHIHTHTGEKPYRCKMCGKQSAQKLNMRAHIKGVHKMSWPETLKYMIIEDTSNMTSTLKKKGHPSTRGISSQNSHSNVMDKWPSVKGDGPHQCKLCGLTVKYYNTLVRHMRLHKGVKVVKSATHADLVEKITFIRGRYECPVCIKRFKHHHHTSNHIYMHTADSPYKCDICGESFKKQYILRKHQIKRHTTVNKPYRCSVCKISFTEKVSLSQHMSLHETNRTYKCRVCQVSFIYTGINGQMAKNKTFTCPDCHKQQNADQESSEVSDTDMMDKHKRPAKIASKSSKDRSDQHHKPTEPDDSSDSSESNYDYVCHVCDHYFGNLEELSGHMKEYMVDLPFLCDICESIGENKLHIKTHMNLITLSCKPCQISFPNRIDLEVHMATHMQLQRVTCKLCGQGDFTIEELHQHQLKHTNDRSSHTVATSIVAQSAKTFVDSQGTGLTSTQPPISVSSSGRALPSQASLPCSDRPYHSVTSQSNTGRSSHNSSSGSSERASARHPSSDSAPNRHTIGDRARAPNTSGDRVSIRHSSGDQSQHSNPYQASARHSSGERASSTQMKHAKQSFGKRTPPDQLQQPQHEKVDLSQAHMDKFVITIKNQDGTERYNCKVCGIVCKFYNTLVSHIQLHRLAEQRANSPIIQPSINQPMNMATSRDVDAINKQHNGYPFQCHSCTKTFSSKSHMMTHIKASHRVDNPYQCQICEKNFSMPSLLDIHMESHTKEKTYKPGACSQSFSEAQQLAMHHTVHTVDKPYVCELCVETFSTRDQKNTHLKKHTFNASMFKQIQSQRKAAATEAVHDSHMSSSTTFRCGYCPRFFNTQHWLRHHIVHDHSEQIDDTSYQSAPVTKTSEPKKLIPSSLAKGAGAIPDVNKRGPGRPRKKTSQTQ